eukprot:15467397-Alexandrium_andersonii.AAC.1
MSPAGHREPPEAQPCFAPWASAACGATLRSPLGKGCLRRAVHLPLGKGCLWRNATSTPWARFTRGATPLPFLDRALPDRSGRRHSSRPRPLSDSPGQPARPPA